MNFFSNGSRAAIGESETKSTNLNYINGIEEYWVDSDGIIAASNAEKVTLSGYLIGQVVRRDFYDLFFARTSFSRKRHRQILKDINQLKRITERAIIEKANGQKILAKITWEKQPMAGVAANIKVLVQDSMQTPIIQTRFERLEAKYNSLFHNQFIGILIVKFDTLTLESANTKACEILQDFEYKNKPLRKFVDEKNFAAFEQQLNERRSGRSSLKLMNTSGPNRWIDVNYVSFETEGTIEMLLYDVTRDKARIAELEAKSVELNDLFFPITQEMKVSIKTLLRLLRIAQLEKNPSTFGKHVELMLDRTSRLEHMLKDLTAIEYGGDTQTSEESIR